MGCMSILLPFPSGCVVGRLVRREKRFFVHVLIDGKPDVAHTNNTGSMIGLLRPGAPVLLSPAQNPGRKLRWTLELVWCGDPAAYPRGGFWAGVNTSTPNRMLEAAFRAGKLPWKDTLHSRGKRCGARAGWTVCSKGRGCPGSGLSARTSPCRRMTWRCSRMPFPSGGSSIWGR